TLHCAQGGVNESILLSGSATGHLPPIGPKKSSRPLKIADCTLRVASPTEIARTGAAVPHLRPRAYRRFVLSVSQASIRPPSKPRLNQRARCSDVPWVNESGTT